MNEIQFERHMSYSDALLWAIETDPVLRSTILAVAVLDRPPDRRRLLERLDRVSRVVPRTRQRVAVPPVVPTPPRWVTEPAVDLGYHLRWVRTAGDGSMRDLLDLATPMVMQGFDRARPLWEFVVVEGLEDGRAGLIQKLHHSITDGVGGIRLAMNLLDLERDPAGDPSPLPAPPEAERMGTRELLAEALDWERRRQMGTARRSVATVLGALRDPPRAAGRLSGVAVSAARILKPASRPLSPIMAERSLRVRLDTLTTPLGDLKAAARRAGGKLNDAFVAAVARGLCRYHEATGSPVERLRMGMPINLRAGDAETRAGNQFVPARFVVPVAVEDPLEHMRLIRDLVARQRAEPALAFSDAIAGILYRMPRGLTVNLFGSMLKGVDFITSNVPGAPIPVYLAGARLEANVAFGPMSGAACNVTLLSHVDEIRLGVSTDPAAVDDPELFVSCLDAGLEEIRKLA